MQNVGLLRLPDEVDAGAVTVDRTRLSRRAVLSRIRVSFVHGSVSRRLTSTATQMYELDLAIAGSLIVDATSRIDVNGKGYLPGHTTGNTTVGGATGATEAATADSGS